MKMNYVVLGTNDMEASTAFYDALFEGTGVTRLTPSERMTYWIGDAFAFAVATPFNAEPATNGNGSMIGFSFGSSAAVTERYTRALALGATSEGEPGQRGPRFSSYVRDLDGNKLCLSD